MALTKIRSYRKEVIEPLFALGKRNLNFWTEFMGSVRCEQDIYPLFYVTIAAKGVVNPKDVLISAGVHGEEPAGVYALLKFLREEVSDFLGDYRFLVFPCINPFGFEHGHRFNPYGIDINRHFKPDTNCHEAAKVIQVLSKLERRFAFSVDLHETDPDWASEGFTAADNPHTFYMWETAFDKSIRIGDKVVEEVGRIAPLCDWPKIYKDTNHGGIIWYPEDCSNPVYALGTTLDGFLGANYTPQSFTLETPCGWDMEKRVTTHLVALRKILELKRNA